VKEAPGRGCRCGDLRCCAQPHRSLAQGSCVSVDLARSALKMAKSCCGRARQLGGQVFQGDLFPDFWNEVRKSFHPFTAHFARRPPESESAETLHRGEKSCSQAPLERRHAGVADRICGPIGRTAWPLWRPSRSSVRKSAARREKLRVEIDAVQTNFAFADILERKGLITLPKKSRRKGRYYGD